MAATVQRLTKADRRAQLLDVAADLVLESGTAAVTMERLAERAGVSKALVYLHFENSGAVLAGLYAQEVAQLGAGVLHAVGTSGEPERRLRAAIATYLDVVRDRGALFTTLSAATRVTTASSRSDEARVAQRFVADLFVDIFALAPKRAQVAATMFLGALNAGVEAWALGELRRREVEDAAVSIGLHLAGEP